MMLLKRHSWRKVNTTLDRNFALWTQIPKRNSGDHYWQRKQKTSFLKKCGRAVEVRYTFLSCKNNGGKFHTMSTKRGSRKGACRITISKIDDNI